MEKKVEDAQEISRTEAFVKKWKHRISLFLGFVSVATPFVFFLLIPLVIFKQSTTLYYDFINEPVHCKVDSVQTIHGKSNCSWSSCSEGCTSTKYRCYQVTVVYSLQAWENVSLHVDEIDYWIDYETTRKLKSLEKRSILLDDKPEVNKIKQEQLTKDQVTKEKDQHHMPLMVNAIGCGYPPEVDCERFIENYQKISKNRETFPCFYSQIRPWIVIEDYNYDETLNSLVMSFCVPVGLFAFSLLVLILWYCPPSWLVLSSRCSQSLRKSMSSKSTKKRNETEMKIINPTDNEERKSIISHED